jgi:hypothetical protein
VIAPSVAPGAGEAGVGAGARGIGGRVLGIVQTVQPQKVGTVLGALQTRLSGMMLPFGGLSTGWELVLAANKGLAALMMGTGAVMLLVAAVMWIEDMFRLR